jgi:hypothetical protein
LAGFYLKMMHKQSLRFVSISVCFSVIETERFGKLQGTVCMNFAAQ